VAVYPCVRMVACRQAQWVTVSGNKIRISPLCCCEVSGGHVHLTASSSEEKVNGTQFVVKWNVEKPRHCFCTFFQKQNLETKCYSWRKTVYHLLQFSRQQVQCDFVIDTNLIHNFFYINYIKLSSLLMEYLFCLF